MLRRFEYVERIKSNGYQMNEIKFELPKRSTKNSGAYDFYSPENFKLEPKKMYMLKTGIKAYMADDEILILNVRSSMGKKQIMLANSSAWIDSDYVDNLDNEGEIGLLFYNYGEEIWEVNQGDRIAQGMFVKYLKVDNDIVKNERKGGWGSTNGK